MAGTPGSLPVVRDGRARREDQPVRIALSDAARAEFGRDIRRCAPGALFVSEIADAQIGWATVDQHAAGTLAGFYDTLAAAPRLEWVQLAGAGTDDPAVRRLAHRGVPLLRGPDTGPVIAEYVLRAVLDVFQDARSWRAAQQRREWSRHELRTVRGSTWVVAGHGRVGSAVCRAARALGAEVVVASRHRPDGCDAGSWVGLDRLAEAAARADALVLCLAANDETRHICDRGVLAAMKAYAVVVNVGRGSLVDEAALTDALDAGRPGLAVLDVVGEEPLSASSPLWTHPRVEITPHNAAAAADRRRWAAEQFCARLGGWLREGSLAELAAP